MLGVGNMSGAILEGLRARRGADEPPIRVTTRSAASAATYADASDVEAMSTERDPDANRHAVRGADVVVLGVKPHMVADLLDEIAPEVGLGTIVVSVAAGVTAAAMERRLPAGARVVRAMPNTPATLGLGVTGIAPGAAADDEAMAIATRIFESVGDVVEVPESRIAAVAGISGSGPAYVYLFMEDLIRAAEARGFTPEQARTMVVATFRGASELATRASDTDPAELRRHVTSPNGTTERAIGVFQEAGLAEIVDRAVQANIDRSDELAADNA
ncbi:pyrroline-5-carboxylate reductase [Pseudoclavibacter chungangensis]|uniref:Pyrroline-5-carboxylate reductase n=1 Tax=Pseudoclavibacter chungangensis TaxID=587635 RepID=A0A7J5BQ79_9MICO|nr:pyrroline-5-carboxylate reductase [Pseudoclavibacter chungangensis]KAB1655692.1 pyrroline-5-carboxylate reductase [Pseudoclavibacter chungangensis]